MKDNLNQANWPHHSDLFSLEPSRLGTNGIEALSAFSRRLADAHSMEVVDLYNHIFSREEFGDKPLLFHNLARQLDGISYYTDVCINTFEKLTLQSGLKQLTLLRWADMFSILPLMRKKAAWCANCYQGWHDRGETVSNPLKWRLNLYDFCELHERPLSTHCPHADCGREFSNLPGTGGIGFCPHCNRWLGSSEQATGNEGSDAERIRSQFISSFLFIDLPPNMSSSSLAKSSLLLAHYKTGLTKKALFSEINNSLQNFRYYEAGTRKLSLKLLSDLVIFAQLTTTEILEVHDELIIQHNKMNIPSSATILRQDEHARLRKALEEALDSKVIPPPSTNKIAKSLNIRVSSLERIFPDLCDQITKKFQNYKKTQFKTDVETFLKNELKITDRPPMRISEIADYFGLESSDAIRVSNPRLHTKIIKRWNSYHGLSKDDQLQKARLYLESLLNSNADPCPSTIQIADELDMKIHFLDWNFHDLLEKIMKLRSTNYDRWIQSVESRLKAALEQDNPDSLDIIAEELMVSRDFFYDHFADLAKSITAKRKDYDKAILEEAISKLRSEGICLSPSEFAMKLGIELGYFRKNFPDHHFDVSEDYRIHKENRDKSIAAKLSEIIMDDNYAALNCKEVAAILGIDYARFRSLYPEEQQFLVKRHETYLATLREVNYQAKESLLRQTMYDLHQRGIPPSRKNIYSETKLAIYTGRRLEVAYFKILGELGYNTNS